MTTPVPILITTNTGARGGSFLTVLSSTGAEQDVGSTITTDIGGPFDPLGAAAAAQAASQPLNANLTALAGLNATGGVVVETAANTFTKRTLTGTANEITITNGDGVAGAPTISIPTAVTLTGKTLTGGTLASPTISSPTISTPVITGLATVNSSVRTTGNGSVVIANAGYFSYVAGTTAQILVYGPDAATPGAFQVTGLSSDASAGDIRLAISNAGQVSIPTATDASSTTTGAMTTLGGISYGATKTLYGGGVNLVGNIVQTGATTLSTGTGAVSLNGDTTLADAKNVILNTTTGSKIGTATSQKLAFWNQTPGIQPTTGITAAAFVANTSGTVNDSATWGGYTIGQVVAALKAIGLLA